MLPADIRDLDANDPLATYRDHFIVPDDLIYLDGNSLGALPRTTPRAVQEIVEDEWGRDLIAGWNSHGWYEASDRLALLLAPVIGAEASEIAVCDSISVNLFKLIAGALSLRPERRVILADRSNFPTDLYIAQGIARLLGVELRLHDSVEAMANAIDHNTALIMASHVDFKTGLIHDMAGITARAHELGALALWDLAHSAGALPVTLNAAQADMAVGCTYKYLNGGPGAPAFLFVAQRHHRLVQQPISGWFGHESPFAFETEFRPTSGIRRFLAGTPPMLAMRALQCGLEIAAEAPLDAIRNKSIALSSLFLELFEARLAGHGFTLASPRDPAIRGSQISFAHEQGYAIMQALIAHGVVGDFRAPDIMRFGFTPLYLRFADITEAVERLVRIMDEGIWREPRFHQRATVT